MCVCVCVCESLSCVWLFVTPWTVARQNSSPWSSPDNNTGVGFHPLLIGIFLIWVSCIVGRFFTIWTTKEAQCLGYQKLKDERKELSHTGFSRNLTLISPFWDISSQNVRQWISYSYSSPRKRICPLLGCCSPWGCKESDMTEGLNKDNTHNHKLLKFSELAFLKFIWRWSPTNILQNKYLN